MKKSIILLLLCIPLSLFAKVYNVQKANIRIEIPSKWKVKETSRTLRANFPNGKAKVVIKKQSTKKKYIPAHIETLLKRMFKDVKITKSGKSTFKSMPIVYSDFTAIDKYTPIKGSLAIFKNEKVYFSVLLMAPKKCFPRYRRNLEMITETIFPTKNSQLFKYYPARLRFLIPADWRIEDTGTRIKAVSPSGLCYYTLHRMSQPSLSTATEFIYRQARTGLKGAVLGKLESGRHNKMRYRHFTVNDKRGNQLGMFAVMDTRKGIVLYRVYTHKRTGKKELAQLDKVLESLERI